MKLLERLLSITRRTSSEPAVPIGPLLTQFRDAFGRDASPIVSEPLGSRKVYLASTGGSLLLSDNSLLSIIRAAEKLGFAITPPSNGFGELIAVTEAVKNGLPSNPAEWAAHLLGRTPDVYVGTVHNLIREIVPAIEEQIVVGLSNVNYPQNFVFELANVCNLACPICPRHHRAISDGLMELEDAKSVIKDLAAVNDEFTLYPYYLGETLIHPDFLKFVDYVLEFPHIKLNIVSNGILLTEAISNELLSRNIKSYHFSLHDCDTALHDGVHPRNAVSSRNVLNFLAEADRRGCRQQFWAGVSMVPIQLNEPAVEAFREFWQPLVNAVNIYAYLTPERRTSDPAIEAAFSEIYLPCSSPWVQPVISVDGSVLPCCWDYEHTMPMGNVFEQSFAEIYRGPKFDDLRKMSLAKDLKSYPTCASCSKWVDYLPAFRSIEMEAFNFQSNGTYLSFQTKAVDPSMIAERQAELKIDGSGRQNLPIHRAGRSQAKRGFHR